MKAPLLKDFVEGLSFTRFRFEDAGKVIPGPTRKPVYLGRVELGRSPAAEIPSENGDQLIVLVREDELGFFCAETFGTKEPVRGRWGAAIVHEMAHSCYYRHAWFESKPVARPPINAFPSLTESAALAAENRWWQAQTGGEKLVRRRGYETEDCMRRTREYVEKSGGR